MPSLQDLIAKNKEEKPEDETPSTELSLSSSSSSSKPTDVTGIRNARIEEAQAKADEERQQFFELSTKEKEETTNPSLNRAVIKESHESNQYLRDGNVVWPAPVERPAGISPNRVAEALEFFNDVNENNRKAES